MPEAGYYKSQHTFAARLKTSEQHRIAKPHCIPIIIERSANTPKSDEYLLGKSRSRFSAPRADTFGHFMAYIRRQAAASLDPKDTIFFFVNDTLPSVSQTLGQIYDEGKDQDGMLYLTWARENTFGAL